jgi:hypothetical protein
LLVRSVFIVEKKLSIAALSQQSPRRLMLQAIPSSQGEAIAVGVVRIAGRKAAEESD